MINFDKRDSLGRFRKGITPWNKGKKNVYSEEVLKIMSNSKKGKRISPKTEFKKGDLPWNAGMKGLYIKGSENGWFKRGHKWPKEIEEDMKKKRRDSIIIKPNLKISEDLAYILGVLYGDGTVYKTNHSYRVALDVTNKMFADNFYNSLKKIGLNPYSTKLNPSNGIGKKQKHIVLANSLIFGEWLNKLNYDKLKKIISERDHMVAFIKGFYESEGSISIDKRNYSVITISINNTDQGLINLIAHFTDSLNINMNITGPYKNSGSLSKGKPKLIYRISTSKKESVDNFINIVNPDIKNMESLAHG